MSYNDWYDRPRYQPLRSPSRTWGVFVLRNCFVLQLLAYQPPFVFTFVLQRYNIFLRYANFWARKCLFTSFFFLSYMYTLRQCPFLRCFECCSSTMIFAMTKLTKLTKSGQNHLLSSPSCAGRAQDVISTNCYSKPAPWLQAIVILGANTPIHGKNSCGKQR